MQLPRPLAFIALSVFRTLGLLRGDDTSPIAVWSCSPAAAPRVLTGLLLAVVLIIDPVMAQEIDVVAPPKSFESPMPEGDNPAFIFFPPVPPPLDEPPPWPDPRQAANPNYWPSPSGSPVRRSRGLPVRSPSPPAELSPYINELFYAPLSTRLLKNELTTVLRARLERYRVGRDELVEELRLEIARLRPAEAAARQGELEAFARQQASLLAALEDTAESLRLDLVSSFYGWFVLRRWHLGQRGYVDTPEQVAGVMRAYAHFHKELRPEIRGLLREIAMEYGVAKADHASNPAERDFFFSPETARVRLPDDLPASVAARIADYAAKKSLLKKRLQDAVVHQEQASFLRGNTLRNWQAEQTAALAELEELAAIIRRELVGLPSLTPARPPSPLPPELTDRFAALRRGLNELQEKTRRQIADVEREIPHFSNPQPGSSPIPFGGVTYDFDNNGLIFEVRFANAGLGSTRAGRPPNVEAQRSFEKTQAAMTAIAEEYGRVSSGIVNEMAAVSAELPRTLAPPSGSNAEDPVKGMNEFLTAQERGLKAINRYLDAQEKPAAYEDYRAAVFEPGLSAVQRRLLFGHAIRTLGLPLPLGELQPTVRDR
ncbi:MAG: hypothetical protein ABIO94_00950 [Opitutaceae bacterium]